MAERQYPGIAPDQVHRQGHHRITHNLAGECHPVRRDVERAVCRYHEVEYRENDKQHECERAERENESGHPVLDHGSFLVMRG